MMAADRGAVRGHYGQPRGKAEGRMQKEESRRQGLGPGYRAEELRGGILEHALGEGVIKFLTVRNLICRCLGGGYRNSRGRQGRVRRMLLAGRALDCGRCARPLRNAEYREAELGMQELKDGALSMADSGFPDFL